MVESDLGPGVGCVWWSVCIFGPLREGRRSYRESGLDVVVVDAVAGSGVALGSALRSREGVVRVLEADAVAAWDGPGMVISAVLGCEACISGSEREQPQRAAIIVEAEDMPATTLTPPQQPTAALSSRAQGVYRARRQMSAR